MSYVCYLCKGLITGGIRGLFTHLRSTHFVCELRSVTLKCGQGDCLRCYSTFNSLARHLRDQHPDASSLLSDDVVHDNSSVAGDETDAPMPPTSDIVNTEQNCPPLWRNVDASAASFVASLLSSTSVTETNVQSVVQHVSTLIADIVDDIRCDVRNSLTLADVDKECVTPLLDRIQQRGKPFGNLETQFKRTQYFRKQYGMVDAKSIFLGNRYDQTLDPVTGVMRPVIKRDTFQYVPILKLVALLLSDDSIYRETMQSHVSVDDQMRDFCDGTLFRSISLFSEDPHALQLCLYFDECEVVNPLGSRRGYHKIGFIYMSLKNLRPMFNSCLSNIHIVAAFNSIDRAKYGFDKILAPIMKDIRALEAGVDLCLHNGLTVHKRGTLVQIAGDNLGLNQLCGFVESFSATHFCRICTINKSDCDSTFKDDSLQMRTKEQYSHQLQRLLAGKLATKECGIKSSCLFNSLNYFHTAENITVDVMHDLLEGVVPFELKLVLFSFIYEQKLFTLELLNCRLACFDYGSCDRKNKPTALSELEIKDQQKNGLNQKASQMFCLFVILPFIVGFEVPETNEMWRLYLLLRRIVDLVFSDSVNVGDSVYLKHLIDDHHSLFKLLFPERRLLPKHHMMVHYPVVMRTMGPLSRSSSIRFEAKHYESKRLCSVVCCFKDICRTVVHRHQLNQCVRIASGTNATYKVSVDSLQVCTVDELPEVEAECILSFHAGFQRHGDISHADNVQVCGTEYRKYTVIVLGVDDLPSFGKIVRCLLDVDENVYFVCQKLKAVFDVHLHAYSVMNDDTMVVVNHRTLQFYRPLPIRHSFDSNQDYVVYP